jgi:hypothetical protein
VARQARHSVRQRPDETPPVVSLLVALNGSDWPALGIAGAGVLLGAISLTWQAVAFRLTGSRVIAHLRIGVITTSMGGQGVLSFAPRNDWEPEFHQLQQQHGGTAVLILTAANVGRLAVGMEDAQARTETGFGWQRAGWALNPGRGDSLAAGHSVSWYVTLDELQAMVDTDAKVRPRNNRRIKVWMELALGDNRTVRTRETIYLTPK